MSGRKVVITGAAGGIGKSLCEVFHGAGYFVLGIDKQEIDKGVPYKTLCFDISVLGAGTPGEDMFFKDVERILDGSLGVLVNNAAVQVVKNIGAITPEDWKKTLDTNLLAPFWLIRRFLPLLRKSKGSVINIASIHSVLTKARFSIYAASKGALVSLTRALAIELAPDVRVNAIIPAATDTPMLRAGFQGNIDGLKELGHYHPMDRVARPEEVANVAVFLAGEQSSFITGSVLHVDGGIGSVLHDPVVAR